jgi:hypothetical protein
VLESSNDFDVAGDSSLVAIGPNGDAVTMWQQSDGVPNGSTLKLYLRRYIAGQGWQAAEVVPVTLGGGFVRLSSDQLFLDASGTLTWIRGNFETRRYTAATGWGTVFLPANSANGSLTSAVMDSRGKISILGIGGSALLYNALPPGGQWGTWVDVDRAGQSIRAAALSHNDNDTFVAVWSFQNPGDSNYSMRGSVSTPTAGWDTPVTLDNSFDNVVADTRPRVAMDSAGNAIAMWHQGPTIYSNRYAAGTGWGTATALDTTVGSTFGARIDLAMAPNGRAVAAWSLLYPFKTTVFTPGSGWSTPVELAPYNLERQLRIDNNGNAIVMYVSVPTWPNPTSSEFSLYTHTLAPGGAWSTRQNIETGVGDVSDVRFAMNAAGQAVAVWRQQDTATTPTRLSFWGAVAR